MKEPWKSVVIGLMNRRVLKLVCVDEIHVFVMFGLTFRKEFTLLKASFFRHLIDESNSLNTTNGCYYLKVPLLLMTATFNRELMSLLELMIGIKILPYNYLWGNRDEMKRRNIKIDVDFTTQRLRHIKNVLSSTLSGNLDKKCIVYTNTASCLEQMQADVESWMDMDDSILGDLLVIHGDQKPEVKFVSAERFTETIANPEELINKDKFYPRILLATAGSIGAGLDSPDVYAVCRVGFPTSIFAMAQELGRCGRGRSNENNLVTDNFHLFLTLDDFVYLNERLFIPGPPIPSNINPILSIEHERRLQHQHLLDLLKMIVLRGDCWHIQLETMLGNPLEPPASSITECMTSCPKCCNDIKSFVMPVKRSGLSIFLLDLYQQSLW